MIDEELLKKTDRLINYIIDHLEEYLAWCDEDPYRDPWDFPIPEEY